MYRSKFRWSCSCGAGGRWAEDRKAVAFRGYKHLRLNGCQRVLVYDSQRPHSPVPLTSTMALDSKDS